MNELPNSDPKIHPLVRRSRAGEYRAAELMEMLEAAGGTRAFGGLSNWDRALLGEAVRSARWFKLVPKGQALIRTTDADGGLTVSLVDETFPKTPVPIPPNGYDKSSAFMKRYASRAGRPRVPADLLDHALTIVQALADGAVRRGFQMAPSEDPDGAGAFQISVNGVVFFFHLGEEIKQGNRPRKDWRPGMPGPKYHLEGTGQLHLHLASPNRNWYDRDRGKLENKLPLVLAFIHENATATLRAKLEKAEDLLVSRRVWEQGRSLAMRRRADALDQEMITKAAEQFGASEKIRLLADRLRVAADAEVSAERKGVLNDWEGLARRRSYELDPVPSLGPRQDHAASDVSDDELQRWMPPGLSAHGPRDLLLGVHSSTHTTSNGQTSALFADPYAEWMRRLHESRKQAR